MGKEEAGATRLSEPTQVCYMEQLMLHRPDFLHPSSDRRMDRRTVLRWSLGCCFGAGAAYSAAIEPRWLEVTDHNIAVPALANSLCDFRIAQLSDLHITSLAAVHDRVLETIRVQDPQLVVLTGDVLQDPGALGAVGEFCRALAAPRRDVVATLGNWEHWGHVPREELSAIYSRTGVRLLGNESIRLASGVSIIATDDACSGNADASAAFKNAPAGAFRLFLTHAPGILDELPSAAPGFDLALAGHTHGGQICALGEPLWVPPGSGRFRSGMYDTPKGRAYISRGVGTSVLPVRFTSRPELPMFRLVAA